MRTERQQGYSQLNQIKEWLTKTLLGWPGNNVEFIGGQDNFVESGVIDSFGIIVLVEEIEKRYGFRFEDRDFQDRRFVTINGLAEIIHAKMAL